MKKYHLIVIGFGKAGKTIAKQASKHGEKVALIEKSAGMYGGTCINIACIPTKVLVEASREGLAFQEAIARKNAVVSALNQKNFHLLADDENIDVIDGLATFKDDKVIAVTKENGEIETLTADKIVINTGASPFIPEIKGVRESRFVYDSTSMMNREELPEKLVIIGGGYIALEFASFFANFGSKVTVVERAENILTKEDPEIAAQVVKDLSGAGIEFVLSADTQEIKDGEQFTTVVTNKGEFEADAVLVAAGRRPNTQNLGLENTNIQVGKGGEVVVNNFLETDVTGVYAAGDVKGGLQFTYISLDDARILQDQWYGKKERSLNNRGNVPYSVFITPVLGRVGYTLDEALKNGYQAVENSLPVSQIPRHKINNDPRGLFKVVVDKESREILGASLYGENAEELINVIKMAMDNHLPFTYLRDNIYTHPTMIESFNDLMNLSL
ncbi:pyruvate/2-oxoglutarate dehydrogenase complex dihydrolipoamide dehydrogenase (E3) component [Streptococcus gallinaceus]|uniref:hypothiocyanous acid reductase MerA n=1 Tax=Streptococcus gallinaceus TaxID=165758 RepID=UPI00209D3C97|nr:hypothiocyanous acid reductase MerA [Streptococcus gallinaceus]MCP1639255.1 pyruvate/2-oxoglutarate dehydrogenase complex dihydrolipoamide dehydrogenase (E3) component [Streptococcus gallinaceus]MCP1770101.1 pyruvate/2-oxoglutarate dehydrogenase complex dihydrolipoamide dehydrogenase (E3) component [Streptococcus gallinaceus]